MADLEAGLTMARTVRRVEPDGAVGPPEPFSAYRETPAWVLLGDPGAGKTTAFQAEESAAPERALFVSARDFLTFDPEDHPEWRERTLFLDGLDEVRAGKSDARTPFDEVRGRLDRLGKPMFRLSCREADWLGKNDRQRLKSVSPDGEVVVLRLDPLSHHEARSVASDLLRGSGVDLFLAAVSERGLDSLLGNPQNLELLARVFRDEGQLPSSRWETFEKASALLAEESNDEHPEVATESLLEAAGRLSAVELLSNAAGHCDSERKATAGHLAISGYGGACRKEHLAALRTRLFTAAEEGCFRAAHAHLAAFLAARHLAGLIEKGAPARRILALLGALDGAPPTPLRGLAAWLAAAAPALRRRLIERDPVAVLIYGDIRDFDPNEKTALLDCVGRDVQRLHKTYWPASAAAALASPEMEPVLLTHLREPDRNRATQDRVVVIATALCAAPPRTWSVAALLAVVGDPKYWPGARQMALRAWLRSVADAPNRTSSVRMVMTGLHEGRISDPDHRLLGALLTQLYPTDMEPSEVWDYFTVPSGLIINDYYMFWANLGKTCPDDHLPAHLDRLSDPTRSIFAGTRSSALRRLPLQLLARTLESHGTQIEVSRLFRWLQLGMDSSGRPAPVNVEPPDPATVVARWLEARPEVQKALIRFALRTPTLRALDSPDAYLKKLLYRSALPADIGTWHLGEAVAAADSHLRERHIGGFLRALAARPIGVDQALAEARTRLKTQSDALRVLEKGLSSDIPEGQLQQAIRWQHLRPTEESADSDLLDAVRSQQEALRGNTASPALLHHLAQQHLEDSLLEALGGDHELRCATLDGLRRTIHRPGLPSGEDLVRLWLRDRMSLFSWPVLVGLAETPVDEVMTLDDERLRMAITCRLLHRDLSSKAEWYSRCLTQRADLVAEVMVHTYRVLLRGSKTLVPDLAHLAHCEEHGEVARHAVLPLLRSFPTRPRKAHLHLLDDLLMSGMRHFNAGRDAASLRDIIEGKLSRRSTSAAARVRWLSAGVVLDPDTFLGALSHDLARSEAAVRSCAEFYQSVAVEPSPWLLKTLTPRVTEVLVRRLGPTHGPEIPAGWVGADAKTSWLISALISCLSESADEQAERLLSNLVVDDDLSEWRLQLEDALHAQRTVRRDAGYAAPAPREVLEALNDGPPATAADLRGLILDRLETIAEEIRTTNANLWRQFWNEDTGTAKHENACRDALLPLLRSRLPDGCDAQPEGQYAANRRADIRVASGKWNVPVEIKKNSHSDLWRAVANQLLSRYANDPATDGLGIYLVLWMGADRTAPLEKGDRPETPADLRERLLDSLNPDERRRAEVVVLDVTRPHAPGGEAGQAP